MPDFSITNWTPVVASIVTAFSTLTAVFITNWFNSKQAKVNLRLMSEHKKFELKLQKLEELYYLFEQWEMNFSSVYLMYLGAYSGKLTYKEVLDLVIKQHEQNDVNFHKIQMLMNIYFSEHLEDYAKVMQMRSQIAKYLSDPSRNGLKQNDFILEQQNFEEVCKNFKIILSNSIGKIL